MIDNNMEKGFDFEKVGKRMPYSVPDGFFDQLETNVMSSVKDTQAPAVQKRPRIVRLALRSVVAAAAALALFFYVNKNEPQSTAEPTDTFAQVELAYNNLSAEDEEYLLDVYESDVFFDDGTTYDETVY